MNEESKIDDILNGLASIMAFLIFIFIAITGIVWVITLCIDFWRGFF